MRFFECNQSAFENFYKPQGYVPVTDKPAAKTLLQDDMPPESTKSKCGLEMKPIGQWTLAELHEYAFNLGWSTKTPEGILRKRIQERIKS